MELHDRLMVGIRTERLGRYLTSGTGLFPCMAKIFDGFFQN